MLFFFFPGHLRGDARRPAAQDGYPKSRLSALLKVGGELTAPSPFLHRESADSICAFNMVCFFSAVTYTVCKFFSPLCKASLCGSRAAHFSLLLLLLHTAFLPQDLCGGT